MKNLNYLENKQNNEIRRFLTKDAGAIAATHFLTINFEWDTKIEVARTRIARLLDRCDRRVLGCRDTSRVPSSLRTQFWARAELVGIQTHVHAFVLLNDAEHKKALLGIIKELKRKKLIKNYNLRKIHSDSSKFRDYPNKEVMEQAVFNVIHMKDLYH